MFRNMFSICSGRGVHIQGEACVFRGMRPYSYYVKRGRACSEEKLKNKKLRWPIYRCFYNHAAREHYCNKTTVYAADASEPFSEAPQILNQVCSTPTFRIPNTAGTIGSTGWNPLHTLHTLVCKTRRGLTAATRAQLKKVERISHHLGFLFCYGVQQTKI